ncbi:MAG: ferrochelatase, partial [Propionibacteriales bacterium]|nr:ferrochelatase [Propionibacteriales bacterium]
SAYSSYSGCRQYREDLFAASVGSSVQLDRLRHYFNHPGFIEPFVEATATALSGLPDDTRVVFVTHSIPATMNAASGGPDAFAYEWQHQGVAQEVSLRVGRQLGRNVDWSLAYCSRSGPPSMPWLAPDINDHLASLRAEGVTAVAVSPIGFISDHMEVIFDLDTEASATAEELGMEFVRVATPHTHPRFVSMIRGLVVERAAAERGDQPERCAVGNLGASPDRCAADCCVNAGTSRPAIGDA